MSMGKDKDPQLQDTDWSHRQGLGPYIVYFVDTAKASFVSD